MDGNNRHITIDISKLSGLEGQSSDEVHAKPSNHPRTSTTTRARNGESHGTPGPSHPVTPGGDLAIRNERVDDEFLQHILPGSQDIDGDIHDQTSSSATEKEKKKDKRSIPFTPDGLKVWLAQDSINPKILNIQRLITYILELSSNEHVNASKAISAAFCRVAPSLAYHDEDNSENTSKVEHGYLACFKSLIYLEIYGVSFDVDLVAGIIRWRVAYKSLGLLCHFYQLKYMGKIRYKYHSYCGITQKIVTPELAKKMLQDLKSIAHQRGKWAISARYESHATYGPRVQPTELSEAAEEFARNGNTVIDDLDNRRPNQTVKKEQEIITIILSAVSAVDAAFGIEREKGEWTDLRECLSAFGVCDNDGDVFGFHSITKESEWYGAIHLGAYELLTPIGYGILTILSPEQSVTRDESRSKVSSFAHLDQYTIQIRYEDGTEELLAFCGDVRFAKLTMNYQYIVNDGMTLIIEYNNPSIVDERDRKHLNEITYAIAKKLIRESLTEPYPSPNGIASIAFALQRPWMSWRGINTAQGAVFVQSLNSLKDCLEQSTLYRADRSKSDWDGYMIDFEVIAITRRIRKRPDSCVLPIYLAHICSHPIFNWNHKSASTPFLIGSPNIVALFNEEDVDHFITYEKERSKDILVLKRKNAPVPENREGGLVVGCNRPWDFLILAIVLFGFCIAPSFDLSEQSWSSAISDAIQNLGTGMAPILLLYLLAIYRGWDVRDMIKGKKRCDSIEIAARVSKRSKEEISMMAKNVGIAREVFQKASNSVALSGGEGDGITTSSNGLDAQKLVDIGVLFISKQDENHPIGMVDVGGYLSMTKDVQTKFWFASEGTLEPGVIKILGRNDLNGVVIH